MMTAVLNGNGNTQHDGLVSMDITQQAYILNLVQRWVFPQYYGWKNSALQPTKFEKNFVDWSTVIVQKSFIYTNHAYRE